MRDQDTIWSPHHSELGAPGHTAFRTVQEPSHLQVEGGGVAQGNSPLEELRPAPLEVGCSPCRTPLLSASQMPGHHHTHPNKQEF